MTFDPEPSNPFGCFGTLFFGLLFLIFGYTTAGNVSAPMALPPISAPAAALAAPVQVLNVNTFEWAVRESFPPQVSLAVHGYWPDGCVVEPQTSVEREGSTITVQISRFVPPDMICAQMLQAYTTEVSLTAALMDGETFLSGEYTVIVNGVEKIITF